MNDGLLNALFVKDVREMRDAQRAYFKTRTKEALIDSKQREAIVDQWLRDYGREMSRYPEQEIKDSPSVDDN